MGKSLQLAAAIGACLLVTACGGGGGGDSSSATTTPPPATPAIPAPPFPISSYSIARVWDEAVLRAIRVDTPRPTVHARNLWHMSAAMYDAWAVYDTKAVGSFVKEKTTTTQLDAARREAISYAAYRVLRNRYALSAKATDTLAELEQLMRSLGYDPDVTNTAGSTPAAIGNRIAAAIIEYGNTDGSNQQGNYADASYKSPNDALIVAFPGNKMNDPNAWQPLALEVAFTQNGIPLTSGVQSYIGGNWNDVKPFALRRASPQVPYVDAGPPPTMGPGDANQLKSEAMEVLRRSSTLSPDIETRIDISPGAYGNNPLGTNGGHGHPVNPKTGAPYPPQNVKVGDFARVLAEFWADGPKSETPPGHWNVLANQMSDHPQASRRYRGEGPTLDRLEWDIKMYFAMNAALHDAAVNCWGVKRLHASARPISLIRWMATNGQSTEPASASYSPLGMPLVDGLSELVTAQTWPGGRHAGLQCCTALSGAPAPCADSQGNPGIEVSCVGEVAVRAWPGEPKDKTLQPYSGVRWIRGKQWAPYQLATFVTPAFPGFASGHSTFSRAAAETLTAFTGDPYFPGGLAEHVAPKDTTLTFEKGPSEDIRLQWATYFDAADQAGQSRLFGGIHINSDDLAGRNAGASVGQQAFTLANSYFSGAVTP